jgi:ribonuclease J
MPIHGEYRHLHFHAQLAGEMGMDKRRIIMAANGDVVELSEGKVRLNGSVDAGMTFVDGLEAGDIQDVTLRDRQKLARDGTFIVVAAIREQDGTPVSPPDITAKGFVYMGNRRQLMKEASHLVSQIIEEKSGQEITDPGLLQEHIHNRLGKFLWKKTKKRPLILAVIVEV